MLVFYCFWQPGVADADIIFLLCGFFYLFLSFCFPRLISAVAGWTSTTAYFHTWCGLSANLGCRSETCCTRLAVNTGRKTSPSRYHRATLSRHTFAAKARIDNQKKTC